MRSLILISVLILVLLTPLVSYIKWYMQPIKIVDIAIIDKSVTNEDRNEHRSINWVLNHNNYRKSDSTLYDPKKDYFGFHPTEPIACKEYETKDMSDFPVSYIDSLADKLDAVYYADMYGVYYNQWYLDSLENEYSPNLYGGMNLEELYLLEKMKMQGKLLFTEFNMLGSPTAWNVRRKTEKLLGIKWSGWTGRYFDSFDTTINKELPSWVTDLYMEQYDTSWHFTTSGIVLVHESEKIVILEEDAELENKVPVIYSSRYCSNQYKTADAVHYPFWFDITFPTTPGNTVIAHYKIHTNKAGDAILAENKIPSEFPAVIEHKGDYWMQYYAGDFANNPFDDNTAFFKGIEKIDILLYNGAPTSREKFFWRFYCPLVTNTLQKYMSLERRPIPEMERLLVYKNGY